MKLYHHPISSNARRAMMAALLLGVDVELQVVDITSGENRKPEYLKINPNGKVPTLEDGDFVLWESNAIMAYLADKTPGNTLFPTDLKMRADIHRWLFWASAHWSPAIATLTRERVLKKMFNLGEPDPSLVKQGEVFLRQFGKVLDDHLAGREYVTGKNLTLADLGIVTPLMYQKAAALPLDAFENIQRWLRNIQELDAWKKTEFSSR